MFLLHKKILCVLQGTEKNPKNFFVCSLRNQKNRYFQRHFYVFSHYYFPKFFLNGYQTEWTVMTYFTYHRRKYRKIRQSLKSDHNIIFDHASTPPPYKRSGDKKRRRSNFVFVCRRSNFFAQNLSPVQFCPIKFQPIDTKCVYIDTKTPV